MGTYTVSLNATNAFGSSVTTKAGYIAAGYTVPVVAFAANVTLGNAPLNVSFTDATTGNPTLWNWTFGDGNVSTAQNPQFRYNLSGTYSVNLTATNPAGSGILVKTNYITVNPTGYPIPDFTGLPLSGNPGVLVTFTDKSYQGSTVGLTYNWSFGDGTFSATQGNVQHVYPYASVYDVNLTITNSVGTAYKFKSQYIAVSPMNQNTNVVYSPQIYRFIFQNLVGTPLSGLSVTASPINLTMPISWTNSLFGVSAQVNLSTGQLAGITGTDGSLGAPMIASMGYYVNVSGTAASGDVVSVSFVEYPPSTGTDILVSLPTSKTPSITVGPVTSTISYNVFNQSLSNVTNVLSVNYYDSSGLTNFTRVTVTNQSGYVLNQTNYTGSSANVIVNNFTYTQGNSTPIGDTLSFGFAAYNPNAGGWNNISQPIVFSSGSPFTGSADYNGWAAIILIVFFSAAFTASTVYIGVIGIGLFAEFSYHIAGWFTPAIGGTAFDAMCIFWIVVGVIGYLTKKSRQVF